MAKAAVVAVALDERDRLTSQHCNRVAGLAFQLGQRCGLSERELGHLHIAACFHDVGKIGIPDKVLKKPTAFDADDWAVMKTHSVKSQRIIAAAGLEDGELIGLAARHHHERYDGRGYPDGLIGESIPFLARIVALADTYDAMARLRCYRPAGNHAQIMAVLNEEQGCQHDPYLVKHFAALIERSRFKAA